MSVPRVALLCGGRSGEHEISLLSARSLLAAVATAPLTIEPIVIARDGRLLPAAASAAALAAGSAPTGSLGWHEALPRLLAHDVAFPLLHGPFGEDGTIQGLLATVGMPMVGSGVLASALCMDKAMTKEVLRAHGFAQVPHLLVRRDAYAADPEATHRAAAALTLPLFVKPANLGSSVGMSRVTERAALPAAIAQAMQHDRRVLIEQGVVRPRELEVAVLGLPGRAAASVVGEITYDAAFYDYETKYTPGRAALHIPAAVPAALAEQVREQALAAFTAVDAAGLARIDFLYSEADGLVLNEINTMPGFTPLSMYPQLWAHTGVPYPDLVTRLVTLARA